MKVQRKNILIVVILLVIIAAANIYFDNNFLEVSQYTVKSNKIPTSFKDFKILQLSDLHSKNFGNRNNKLIKKINSENPDIVVMTGDMVNTKDTDFEVFINLAEQISKRYDTYYIVGNHEQNLNDDRRKILIDKLNEIGIRVLDNEKVTITRAPRYKFIRVMNLRYYKDLNNEYTKDVFWGGHSKYFE